MAQNLYPEKVDISNCDKEPIHIIGKSQSHGVIVACDSENLVINQVGVNCADFFGIDHDSLLGSPLAELIGDQHVKQFESSLKDEGFIESFELELNGNMFIVIPHLSGDKLLLDFEKTESLAKSDSFQKQLSRILNTLSASKDSKELCQDAARITKDIFGYDRVMIYYFDEEWNGEVIAEEREDHLESWLGLHYPSTDIPKQSRALFMKHRVRIIADVNYEPVSIEPELDPVTGNPLDLSKSELRGVSPIHIEYLQNMNVGASLTAALISNGKLWGLLACHHYSAKFINYYQRQTCHFLTQIFSNELSLKETNRYLKEISDSDHVRNQLIANISKTKKIKKGLTGYDLKFTDLIDSEGGAVILNGKVKLVGDTPSIKDVKHLMKNFLSKREDSIFYHKNLTRFFPEAKKYQDVASGILSIKLGQSDNDYLIWFRPEVIQTVDWGGNPDKKANYDIEKQRLTPRKSFEKWTEELTGVSDSWKEYEIMAAKSLRESVSYVILDQQKKKIDALNEKLTNAHDELELFSQGLSHDLKAPLRGIDGYAYILKEDYYQKVGREGQLAIDTILSSAEEMRELIDNILSFAGVSAENIQKTIISVNHLLEDQLRSLNAKKNYPSTKIKITEDMPKMVGDRRMLVQVWSNLLINALKYSEKEKQPEIEIGYKAKDSKTVYYIKDNGIGFDPKFSEEIFELFSRFSGDNYKGSGVGLAIVKKIIEKHNGRIWVESRPNEGTQFYFHL